MKYCNCHEYLQDVGLLVLRLSIGLMMSLGHGLAKFSQFFQGGEIQFADPIGIGTNLSFYLVGTTEFILSLMVVVGLFTRWAAIPLIFTMSVAVLIVHGAQTFVEKEIALLYLFSFLTILLTGPGKISVDYWIKNKFCQKSKIDLQV
ncbi:MAG: hypothetical protein A2381_01825 [Bdellovibrionales bacterium RIFOXYB1_FULL_37_110]|nr:MAG: hypothetical protein A2417_15690 [Bdellovibrionales bacterium RIFOXYC1_FULL_37_79]OFZ58954.1 MAG: hypothetical protein A2381_01825 [Bdellovibrionales bacterium RIFOXYB1_FULL_37_110]OFZ64600.1 MAG: hypothetical protein A2577_13110 [Bdellovibrionales bacterium RIFOXYD1_FULL_36_51]